MGPGARERRLSGLRDSLNSAASNLRDAAGKMDSLHSSLSEALEGGDLSTLRTVIGNNPEALAAALAAPVGVEKTPVYPVANFRLPDGRPCTPSWPCGSAPSSWSCPCART